MKKVILMLVVLFLAIFAFAQTQNNTANDKLLKAVYDASETGIDIAINQGADIHMKDSFDRNLLMKLVSSSYAKFIEDETNVRKYADDIKRGGVAQHLIDLGVDVNGKDRIDDTPLMYAAKAGYSQVVKTLIRNKAKVDAIGSAHRTALIKAIDNYRPYVMGQFVGQIPHGKYIEIVTTLVKKAPEVIDVQDTNGDTALHIAASKGERDVVEILIKKGKARKDLKNSRNKTPYDYASELYDRVLDEQRHGFSSSRYKLSDIKKMMELTELPTKKVEKQIGQNVTKKVDEVLS